MKKGIVNCPVHGDNETTKNCPDCRPYMKTKKTFICKTCGKEKLDYVSSGRKYCSLSCRPSPRKHKDSRLTLSCFNCGIELKKYQCQIKNYDRTFCSIYCRLKGMYKGKTAWNKGLEGFMGGEKSHLWKGGITPLNQKIRHSIEYKLWREAVFKRDDYTCQFCEERGGELHADHIKPFAYFPELRFAIDNGRTLCKSCHLKTPTWGGKGRMLYEG